MNTLRILTWNCHGAFRRKHKQIAIYQADVAIIQECEDPAYYSYDEVCYENYIWTGERKQRGLAIFSKKNIELNQLDWPDYGLKHFIPCSLNGQLNLLAVWTKNANDHGYIGQLWKYLQFNSAALDVQNAIICGDLNSNAIWDRPRRHWNHSHVVEILQSMNILSAYHHTWGDAHGAETTPTFYMYRNLEKPYHIDYIFLSERLIKSPYFKISIGRPEKWIAYSDHMPLICDVEIP
jgi:exonuclease III